MPATYSSRLRLTKQGDNDNPNTWGQVVNDQVIELLEDAIAGVVTVDITGSSNINLATAVVNGGTDSARNAVLVLTGTLGANIDLIVPAVEKTYIVKTSYTGAFSVNVKPAGGSSGVSMVTGEVAFMFTEGTNITEIVRKVDSSVFLVKSLNLSDIPDKRVARNNLGLGSQVSVLTSNYTVLTADRGKVYVLDASSGNLTISLPSVAAALDGFNVSFIRIDNSVNTVTIDPNSSEAINGQPIYSLVGQYSSADIVCSGTAWFVQNASKAPASSLPTRVYYSSGSGTFTVPAGVTKVRVTVAGAGGGGHGGDGNFSIYAGKGGDSTVTYSATTVTAEGGWGGIFSSTNLNAKPLAIGTNGDINIAGGGATGGHSSVNGANEIKDGCRGALAIKDFTVNPSDVITYSVGAGGTKLDAGFNVSIDGASGYIILEY